MVEHLDPDDDEREEDYMNDEDFDEEEEEGFSEDEDSEDDRRADDRVIADFLDFGNSLQVKGTVAPMSATYHPLYSLANFPA